MLENLLIGVAFAQETSDGKQPFWIQMLPFVLIIFVFYFLIIRPQQKKSKMQKAFIAALKNNDKVITSSGIYGKIKSISKDQTTVNLEVADKIILKVKREHIVSKNL